MKTRWTKLEAEHIRKEIAQLLETKNFVVIGTDAPVPGDPDLVWNFNSVLGGTKTALMGMSVYWDKKIKPAIERLAHE